MTSVAPAAAENSAKPTKKSFDDNWNFIRKLSLFGGIFVLPDIIPTQKRWLKRILIFNIPIGYIVMLFFAYGTFKRYNFSLMSHILCDSILINYTAVFYGFSCIRRHLPKMVEFLNWSRSLYNYTEKYHKIQQEIAAKQVDWVHLWSNRAIQVTTAVMYLDSFMISVGFAIVGQFLPERIYPKYSPPMPYYFPIAEENQKCWKAFFMMLAGQFKCSIDLATLHSLFLSIFYTISIHIYMHLEVTRQTIDLMAKHFQAKHDLRVYGKTEIDNIDIETGLKLKEWIKLIVDMISESNKILTQLGEIFTGYFFLFELASFGALFIFGMIMMVLHQQYFFAFGIVGASVITFSFCFINEQLLKKIGEISTTLYEFPWYTLTPYERKFFLQVMTNSDIKRGFKASGIHDVTFERFSKIVQAAYSNVLVLKDLVMKF